MNVQGATALDLDQSPSEGGRIETSLAHRRPTAPSGRLLRPGRNCWRVETARRAACLVDGEAYFAAARQALLRARHSVVLLGWNFAEYASLQRGMGDPDWPDRLGDFLRALVERRPGLRVHVLVWDKAALMALQRRRPPGLQAARMNEERLRYRLDEEHPAFAPLTRNCWSSTMPSPSAAVSTSPAIAGTRGRTGPAIRGGAGRPACRMSRTTTS
jgi:hypothetical protein